MNFVMSVVLAITLMWGGCLSCANYFRAPAKVAGRCCHTDGSCKDKPGSPKSTSDCNIQQAALSNAKALDAALQPTLVSAIPQASFIPRAALFQAQREFPAIPPDRGTPPDLNLLYSIFRI